MVDRQHLNRITYGVENLLDIYLTCKLPEPDWKCVVPGFNDELRCDPLIIAVQPEKSAHSLNFSSANTSGRGRFAPSSVYHVVDTTRQPQESKTEATKDYFKTGIDKPDEVHIYSGRKPVSINNTNTAIDQMLERLNVKPNEPPADIQKTAIEITVHDKIVFPTSNEGTPSELKTNEPLINNSHHITAAPIAVNNPGNSASPLSPVIESSNNEISLNYDELKNEPKSPNSSKNKDPLNKQMKTEPHKQSAPMEHIEIKSQEVYFNQPKAVKSQKPQQTTQKSTPVTVSNNKAKSNNKNDGNINSNLNNEGKIHQELDIDEFVPKGKTTNVQKPANVAAVINNNSSNRKNSDLKTNRDVSKNVNIKSEEKYSSNSQRAKSNSQSNPTVLSDLLPKKGTGSNQISAAAEPKGWIAPENQNSTGTFESIEKDQQAQEERIKRQARIEAAKIKASVKPTAKVAAPTTWNYVESEPVNLEAIMEEERRNLKKSRASSNNTVVASNSPKQGIKSMIPPAVQSKNASKKGDPFWNIASDASKYPSNL